MSDSTPTPNFPEQPSSKKRSHWIPFIAVGVGILILGILILTRPKVPVSAVEERSFPVSVVEILPQPLSPHLVLLGRVESPRVSNLASPIMAYVQDVLAFEGDYHNAGDVLIVLDERDQLLLLEQREAEVEDAGANISSEMQRFETAKETLKHDEALLALYQTEVKRQESLFKTGLNSQTQVDAAKQAYEQQARVVAQSKREVEDHPNRLQQLKANLMRVEAARDQTSIDLIRGIVIMPFHGRVSQVEVSVGERVTVGAPLITVYDTHYLEVRAQIPSRYLSGIQIALFNGKKQTLTARAIVNDEVVALELDRLAGLVQTGQGGVDGLFRVTHGGRLLELGRSVTLMVELPAEPNAVSLPAAALYGSDRIYKNVDGRMHAVKVQYLGEHLADDGENQVLVRSPELHAGDQVVISHLVNAAEGLKLSVGE